MPIIQRYCQNCGDRYWVRPDGSRRWCPFCERVLTPEREKLYRERMLARRKHDRPADPAAEDDQREAGAGRGKFRSGYRHLLGGDAPRCKPADTVAAAAFVERIEQVLELAARGDSDEGFALSRTERTRLYKLRDKWNRRAVGRDAWFNLFGNRSGGLDDYDQRRLDDERRRIRLLD